MEAKLTNRICGLAQISADEYRDEHCGKSPTQEQDRSFAEGYFKADWRTLMKEGFTEFQQAEVRSIWETAFFNLVMASG